MKKNPIVTIETEYEDSIKIELFPKVAPNTVNNFINLINKGFYDGLTFHRIVKGFVLQGGDPKGDGTGGPGYSIRGEFSSNGFNNTLKHEKGIISMARSNDPNSAGSQFFIMLDSMPHLDGNYASFGKVISGFQTISNIANSKTNHNDRPLNKQIMNKVTIDTFGIQYPEPLINI